LLLEESEQSEPASSEELEWYRPVFNVAAHYRWTAGLRLPAAKHHVGGVDFLIAPRAGNGARMLTALPPAFWSRKTGAPADGVGILDVRTTIETHDGALIYVAYSGVGDLGPDGHAKFLRGELPAKLPLRTVPRMQTAHPAYEWVNRCQFLSIGEADLGTFV